MTEEVKAPDVNPNPAVLFGGEADAAPAEPTVDPAISELKGQVTSLTEQITQMREANMMLMMQPPKEAPAPAPLAAPVQPEALPDPIDDAEGYAKGLADRITARVTEQLSKANDQSQTVSNEQGRYNELWEAFQTTHKEHAVDQRQVRYAANIAAEKIAKRGIDVQRYMFSYRDRFMQDVVTEMNSIFGDPTKKAETKPMLPEANRTDGIFGGLDASTVVGTNEDKIAQEEDPFKDIKEWQEKTGFYR